MSTIPIYRIDFAATGGIPIYRISYRRDRRDRSVICGNGGRPRATGATAV